ncbi:three component ABC system middle component [Flavobacterium columnare]|uniref:three component ABC system middle component n=1 Tax=Flavobacterium columnare TaxID=996 RepID=UPI003BA2A7CF
MKASDIERLTFTPFHTSKILHHFLSGINSVNKNGIKTELIYLVLSFIHSEKIQKKLENLKKTSKFNNFIDNPEFDIFFNDINDNIQKFRRSTNNAIIVLSNDVKLNIDKFINPEITIDYKTEKDNYLKRIYKSAFNLGVILGKEDYISVIKKLRLTEI